MMSNKDKFSHLRSSINLNSETNDEDYSYEEKRIKSYVSWQVQYPVDPIRLAKAGFYSTGNEDEVECFSCKGRVKNWNYGDVVLKKHADLFPHCDFVNNTSNNIPVNLVKSQKNEENCNNLKESSFNEQSKLFPVFKSVDYNKMKNLQERVKTFTSKWPAANIDILRIAHAGFFYLGVDDKVQCPFCKGIVSNWEVNDDPLEEHIKHFPWCEYFSKQSSDSFSSKETPWFHVGSEDLCGNEIKQLDFSKTKLIDENQEHIALKKLGVHIHNGPTHPQQSSYAARLRSFSSWPTTVPVFKEDLAKAGFFYIGISDHTKCFHCNGGLCNWEDGDDPWVEHAKWFQNCDFLQLNKGSAFIESCVQQLNKDKKDVQGQSSTFIPSDNLLSKVDDAMKSKVVLQLQETEIFPSYLIRAAVLRQLKETGETFNNVDDLCIAASFLKEQMENEPLKMNTCEALDLNADNIGIQKCNVEEGSDGNHLESSEEISKPFTNLSHKVVDDDKNISSDQCLCKICMDKEVGVVFLPCGHLIACTECAPALKACPMCRKTIQATVRAYLP